MTESEWLASDNPAAMLRHLTHARPPRFTSVIGAPERPRAAPLVSDRKLRLFAVGFWRHTWSSLMAWEEPAPCDVWKTADQAERHADGESYIYPKPDYWLAKPTGLEAARAARAFLGEASQIVQAALLREIAGNPYRPVSVLAKAPTKWGGWLTPDALAIAERAYADRDFAALPVLADALEEAGCENADLLGHLRGPGLHVRGCWALDTVLGKE